MTTHRRAWIQRAGVVVALAASALLAPLAQPASAEPPEININPGSVNLQAGRDATITVRITTKAAEDIAAQVGLTNLPQGVSCARGCGPVTGLVAEAPRNHLVTLRAAGNAPSNRAQITVTVEAPSDSNTGSFNLTVAATQAAPPPPPKVQTVAEVSGRVTDEATGEPVAAATVGLLDSQGRARSTQTNGSGNYRFTGSTDEPIAPGDIQLGAKKGDADKTLTISGRAGQRLTNQRIVLTLAAATTPTPEATPDATAEALPEETGAESGAPAQEVPANASDESGTGLGSWLLILVGGLLVALGVGAIVLLWMRRKENEGESEEDGAATGRPRTAVPGSQGAYHGAGDATRVGGRPGAGDDATMIHSPGLADAPTMMHNRPLVDDEFPDPYGAPLPPPQPPAGPRPPDYGATQAGGWEEDGYGRGGPPTQPGYGAAPSAGYGNAPGSGAGYGAAPGGGYGNAPGSGAGYGNAPASGGAGYGNAPGSGAGYGAAPGGGYGNAPGSGAGYAEPGTGTGYGNAPASGGAGYGNAPGSGAGYAEPGTGYGNAPGTGYGNAPASGGAGYGAEPGYGAAPGSGAPYGGPAGGYGGPAGGYGAPGPSDADEPYGGRGYGGPQGPAGHDYPAGPSAGPGYSAERYDEPTGRYEGRGGGSGAADYGPPADPYESGPYGSPPAPTRGPESQQYGRDPRYDDQGGYDADHQGHGSGAGRGYAGPRAGGGYDASQPGYGPGGGAESGYGQQGYGAAPAGYEQPSTGGGYDQRRAYEEPTGGYGRAPEQRGDGYDSRGYGEQPGGGYYDEPGQGGHGKPGQPPQQPTRSERRSLDWLDD